ncbi:unnamed protein product [Pedinophyceae sp. YPF-701]|nr:unnamed protein product [Pedinophyceae sp. YPF-701]
MPAAGTVPVSTAPVGAARKEGTTDVSDLGLTVPADTMRSLADAKEDTGKQVKLANDGPVVVWFKNDLRLDDHPGLVRALATGRPVIPLFVLDWTLHKPNTVGRSVLLGAVKALRKALEERGSTLVVREGPAPATVANFVRDVGAAAVVAESDVEHAWRDALSTAQEEIVELLANVGSTSAPPHVQLWTAPLYDPALFLDSYPEHGRRRGPAAAPVDAPDALPPLPAGIDAGAIPDGAGGGATHGAPLGLNHLPFVQSDVDGAQLSEEIERVWAGGEAGAREALAAYLRADDGGPRTPLGRKLAALTPLLEAPQGPGGSFTSLFAGALALGTLSPRRVHAEAVQYGRDRNGGNYGATPATRAAISASDTWEFHRQMGLVAANSDATGPSGAPLRHWRWRGVLSDYVFVEGAGGKGAGRPAVLLVHGFGAFSEHWRRNTAELAARGYDVWACTLPGFGRSQKSPMLYTQYLWSDFVGDFAREVVGRPAVVAGNSIGGYISALAAARDPQQFAGLVLVNSAGVIRAGYEQERPVPPSPNPLAVELGSRALFLYLQFGIKSTLQRVYPVQPQFADEWLAEEIERASRDPGALDVFKSSAWLPTPWPLNYCVDQFGGPTMVLQGVLDPLNDAGARANEIERMCPDVRVERLQAGHCPHDEVPETVNEKMDDFIRGIEAGGARTRATASAVSTSA